MIKIEQFTPDDSKIEDFLNLPKSIYGDQASQEQIPSHAQCLLAYEEEKPVARLSIQSAEHLHGTHDSIGMIGHYEALSPEAGKTLLHQAKQLLPQKQIIGPMNGSTWERYRLALPNESEPFFLGEPKNPPEYPSHFQQTGFHPIEIYESRSTEQLTLHEEKFDRLKAKIERQGIKVEPINLNHFEESLQEIYHLSTSSFSQNLFYRPIDYPRFQALYEPIRPLLDPELIHLAHNKEGKLAGIQFAYPDPFTKQVIFKTLAVTPDVRGAGLGIYLFDLLHLKAHQKGYHRVVHALMHQENVSLSMSRKRYNSKPLREYVLYEWSRNDS